MGLRHCIILALVPLTASCIFMSNGTVPGVSPSQEDGGADAAPPTSDAGVSDADDGDVGEADARPSEDVGLPILSGTWCHRTIEGPQGGKLDNVPDLEVTDIAVAGERYVLMVGSAKGDGVFVWVDLVTGQTEEFPLGDIARTADCLDENCIIGTNGAVVLLRPPDNSVHHLMNAPTTAAVAVSDGGYFATDTGIVYELVDSNAPVEVFRAPNGSFRAASAKFSPPQHVLFVGGEIWRYPQAAMRIEPHMLDPLDSNATAVAVAHRQGTAVLATQSGSLYYQQDVDGGWEHEVSLDHEVRDLAFRASGAGWAVGGSISHSVNAGNWKVQPVENPAGEAFIAVDTADPPTAAVKAVTVTESGRLYYFIRSDMDCM